MSGLCKGFSYPTDRNHSRRSRKRRIKNLRPSLSGKPQLLSIGRSSKSPIRR